MGHPGHHSRCSQRTTSFRKGTFDKMGRPSFREQSCHQKNGCRLFRSCLGRYGPHRRPDSTRILAHTTRPTHQCKGTFSRHANCPQFGETKRNSLSSCGQQHKFLVFKKARRSSRFVQRPPPAISALVPSKRNKVGCSTREKFRNASRSLVSATFGPRRLHPEPNLVSANVEAFQTTLSTGQVHSGHVCLSRKCQVSLVHQSPSALGSLGHGRPQHGIGQHTRLLLQPSVVRDIPMVGETTAEPASPVLDGCALLGFNVLVSPTKEACHSQNSSLGCTALSRDVSELCRRINEGAKVAPSLLFVVREMLQREQVPPQSQNLYLARIKNCARYDLAFRKLYALCCINKLDPKDATVLQIAAQIAHLCEVSTADARNAYSACLLLPGMQGLRFNVLLQKCRRQWNTSGPRYSEFWDAENVLERLSHRHFDPTSISQVRDRLLLALRLFHLMRSIDCCRIRRSISFIGKRPFILVQRKGWTQFRWEEVISLPEQEHISPWHLLQKYVHMTHALVPPGGPLFLSLQKPFRPLTADRLGSLTKQILTSFGIPNSWGPHSTRGAGVSFYKRLGMSSEQVAELGKWKDIKTFSQYYLRLQAAQSAAHVLANSSLVHNVSPLECAEPDMSHSPAEKHFEEGRSDMEGGAQNKGEPTQSHPTFAPHKRPLPSGFHCSPSKRRTVVAHGVPTGMAASDPPEASKPGDHGGLDIPGQWPGPTLAHPLRFQFALPVNNSGTSKKSGRRKRFGILTRTDTNKKQ